MAQGLARLTCPCGKQLRGKKVSANGTLRCPACRKVLPVPTPPQEIAATIAPVDALPEPTLAEPVTTTAISLATSPCPETRPADPLWFLRTEPNPPVKPLASRGLFIGLLVLVTTATGWYFWPLLTPLLPWLAPTLTDFDLVPRDARAVVAVRLADLWQGPWQPAQNTLAALEEDVRQLVGLGPAEIERLTLVVPSDAAAATTWLQDGWWLVTTVKPYTAAHIQARLAPNTAEEFCHGQGYYPLPHQPERALHFISKRLFFVGPISALQEFHRSTFGKPPAADSPGRLIHELIAPKPHMVGVCQPPLGLGNILAGTGWPIDLDLGNQAASVSWTAQETEACHLDIHLRFTTEPQANQAQGRVQAALRPGKEPGQTVRKNNPYAASFIALVEKALGNATVTSHADTLTLHLEAPRGSAAQAIMYLMPAWRKQRESHAQTQARDNLQHLAQAMLNYQQAHGHFPPAVVGGGLSWRVALLPFLGHEELYRQFHLDKPWDSPPNLHLLDRMPQVFAPRPGTRAPLYSTFYQVFTGPRTLFPTSATPLPSPIRDGRADTLLIVEAEREVLWTQPHDLLYQPHHLPPLGAQFPHLFLAAFADGQVRTLPCKLDQQTLHALITPAGGEAVKLGRE